jgi:hypothetical protein
MSASRFASKLVIVATWLAIALSPLATRAQTEVSFPVSECIWKWTAKYKCDEAKVTVRIKLVFEPGIAKPHDVLQQDWRKSIVNTWSNKFACMGIDSKLAFDVEWVSAGEHHVVTVKPGSGPPSMNEWYENMKVNAAAHEFGHMLGFADEYVDPQCPMRVLVNTGTVMNWPGLPIVQKYVDAVCSHCGFTESVKPVRPAGTALAADQKMTADDLEKLSRVHLAVSGGPPGDRLQYAITINDETKTVVYKYLNESKLACTKEGVGEIAEGTMARLKTALRGALEAPGTGALVPDTLVATATIEAAGKTLVTRYRLDYTSDDPWGQPKVEAMKEFHRLVTEQAQKAGAIERPQ